MSHSCLGVFELMFADMLGLSLVQVCINGGPVSQVEQAEMPMIVRAATLEAQRSGVRCAIGPIKMLSFAQFCDFCSTSLATTDAQHQSEKDQLSRELEQLRATHRAERMEFTQARDKVSKQKEEAAAECALLKKQLSVRDKEIAQLRHLDGSSLRSPVHQQSAVQLDHGVPFPGNSAEQVTTSSSTEIVRTEPGYMELLGWTIKQRRVGQQDRPTQSDDLWWDNIFSQETARIASRNAGELVQDSELLYQYVVALILKHARAVAPLANFLYPCIHLDT